MKPKELNAPMEQKSVVETETDKETVITENAGLSEPESQALKYWESYLQSCSKTVQLSRRSVVEAWYCGRAFQEVFKGRSRGGWGPWLESKGISKRTADRFRQLSKYYDDVGQLGEFTSVDQALSAARSKRKGPVEEVKPEVETEREVSSGTIEEAAGDNGTPQAPDDTDSAQEIQEVPDKLSETEDQQPVREKELAELRREKTKWGQEKTDLLKEIERLQRLLEENGISWELPSDDQQKEYSPAA